MKRRKEVTVPLEKDAVGELPATTVARLETNMKSPNKRKSVKVIKGFAVLDKKGVFWKLDNWKGLEIFFDRKSAQRQAIDTDTVVPCTITYSLPKN